MAEAKTGEDSKQPENIFLFVPNLIGYARVLFCLLSVWNFIDSPCWAVFFYVTSQLLDAVDGHAARYFGQSTRFGAIFDQLTDRCSTLCLLMTLSYFYPRWMFLFQLSSSVDIASHWLHLHSSDIKGSKHYKLIEDSNNPLNQVLKFYYTSKPFLFTMCATNELFYCSLYCLHFVSGGFGTFFWGALAVVCFPFSFTKSCISLFHLITAAQSIGELDVEERKKTH